MCEGIKKKMGINKTMKCFWFQVEDIFDKMQKWKYILDFQVMLEINKHQ